MVMKYVILSDSWNKQPFTIPRQLTEINGEKLVQRTVRLLKENGIRDIYITSHDIRFDRLGAIRYEPKHNDYNPKENKGYWIDAYPRELLVEPICFLFGDVYYSENAIKTIVNTKAEKNLFFCTYNNTDKRYIKHHDEPLAYKVVDCKTFKKHIDKVKKAKDEGKTVRDPLSWELYRSMHHQDINKHKMTTDFIAINDESCDIDSLGDIISLEIKLRGGNEMVRCEAISTFTLERFDELKNIKRKSTDMKGKLFAGDTFECSEELARYLGGDNSLGKIVIKVVEVIPEEEKAEDKKEYIEKEKPLKAESKKTSKKRSSKK